MKITYMGLCRL